MSEGAGGQGRWEREVLHSAKCFLADDGLNV